jgi:hypothetical protein
MDRAADEACRSTLRTLPASLNGLRPIVPDDLIRLGVKLDGGYVVPSSVLPTADALISFGIGNDWSFEEQLLKRNPNILIHAYDHTVKVIRFLDFIAATWNAHLGAEDSAIGRGITLFVVKSMLDRYESYRSFFQRNVTHFQDRVLDRPDGTRCVTIEEVLARLEGKQQLLLKMDIEGDEYRVIDSLLTYQDRIKLMIVEFHATNFLRDVFLEKIEQIGRYYEIVHVHGNNSEGIAQDGLPILLEVTFLHRNLCTATSRRNRLPVEGLDFPNNPAKPDHELAFVD